MTSARRRFKSKDSWAPCRPPNSSSLQPRANARAAAPRTGHRQTPAPHIVYPSRPPKSTGHPARRFSPPPPPSPPPAPAKAGRSPGGSCFQVLSLGGTGRRAGKDDGFQPARSMWPSGPKTASPQRRREAASTWGSRSTSWPARSASSTPAPSCANSSPRCSCRWPLRPVNRLLRHGVMNSGECYRLFAKQIRRVGRAERAPPTISRACLRWGSLRSTHPTILRNPGYPLRGNPGLNSSSPSGYFSSSLRSLAAWMIA